MLGAKSFAWLLAAPIGTAHVLEGYSPLRECDDRFSHESRGRCPAKCPSLLQCGEGSVQYICVTEATCGQMLPRGIAIPPATNQSAEGGAAEGQGYCASCELAGCDICDNATSCQRCGSGFFELDGKCEWRGKAAWAAVGVIAGSLFLWALVDFCRAHLKETTNFAALKAGHISRWRAKLRNNYVMGRPQHALCSSMHCHTPGQAPIGGPGTVLCMNWFLLIAAVGVWLSLLAFLLAPLWSPKLLDPTLAWKCQMQHDSPSHQHYALWAGLNYLGATVMSAVFLVWQSVLWTRMTHDTAGDICLHFYCVEASGFPADATDKFELLAYLRSQLIHLGLPMDGIQYVSIGYRFTPAQASWVEHALEQHLLEEDAKDPASPRRDDNGLSGSALNALEMQKLAGHEGNWEDHSDSSVGEDDPGGFWVRLLAFVMCGTPFECYDKTVDPHTVCRHDSLELHQDVDSFKSSGLVFVVMKMEPVAVAFASVQSLPGLFRGVHQIKVSRCQSSPQTILWANFHVDACTFWRRAVWSFFLLMAAVAFWFGLYIPFYRLSMSVGSFNFTSFLAIAMSNFSGLFVALANCMISLIIPKLTTFMGFWHQSEQHVADLATLIPCVAVNCLMDFFVTSYSAVQQLSDGLLHSLKLEIVQDSLVYLLFPSYVLLPYLAEPAVTITFAYYLAVLRIKRDSQISPGRAEVAMMAAETDLRVPLADMICTTSTIISTFLLGPSMYHRIFFPLLIVFSAVAYAQYRVRVLRWDSACFQGTKSLHVCQSFYWCFPLGLLAAAWERQLKEVSSNDGKTGWHGFFVHCMLHFIFLRFVLPGLEPAVPSSELSYSEALAQLGGRAGLADYLNTNPVEVLKSHNAPEPCTGLRLIYYRPDKEHLQRRATKFMEGDTGAMMSVLDRMQKDATSVATDMVSEVMTNVRRLDQLTAHGVDFATRRAHFLRARSGSDSETGSGESQ